MRRLTQPLLRAVLVVLLTLVGGSHLWLLGLRLADGSVFEPSVAGRWLAAAALGAAIVGLRRRGVSLVRGRTALVVWLLVALLHGVGGVGAEPAGGADRALPPAELLWLSVPLGTALTALGWAGAISARRRGAPSPAGRRTAGVRRSGRPGASAPLLAAGGPRAPPAGPLFCQS